MKKIAFTFDDGPTSETTVLLEVLKTAQIPATFFVWGERIKGHETILLEMNQAPFSLGNHLYTHPHIETLDNQNVLAEIERADRVIEHLTGEKTRFLRPPYGEWREELTHLVEKKCVLWDVDSLDWQSRNEEAILTEVLERVSQIEKETVVVLLHDLPETIHILPRLIHTLQDLGHVFVSLDEAIDPLVK